MDICAYSLGYSVDLHAPESPHVKAWFPAHGALDKKRNYYEVVG